MRILFIGYSNLFKQRLIPALNQFSEIEEIHIAKFKDQSWDNTYKQLTCPKITLYNSYEEGLSNSNANLAYISSVNSDHYTSAKTALLKNMHTIIDKPAVLNISELLSLFKLPIPNLLLAEALVYTYHPQFNKIKDILQQYNTKIKTINVLFCIPSLESNNFRYDKNLGGGVINDMGPYAVSVGRYFFNEEPQEICCLSAEKYKNVIISFDVIFKYSDNKSIIGHFAFNSEYINSMNILGDNINIYIDKTFSISDQIDAKIKIKNKNNEYTEIVEKANNFYLFFKDVFNTLKTRQYEKFKDIMLKDCKTLELLRHKIII